MSRPQIVYLDSQDYSRFGDVLRGKESAQMEALFLGLERRKQLGDVIFAASMPILTELLQYHPDFRATTMKKAEAVERLCGSWALAYPSRLIGFEIANVARESLSLGTGTEFSPLSNDRYWYPNIAGIFSQMPKQLEDAMDETMAELPAPKNRHERRMRKSVRTKVNPVAAARQVASEMAQTFGIPLSAIHGSVVAYLRGAATDAQVSRALFRAICEPSTFVETYFERVESGRTLPKWLSGAGEKLKANLDALKTQIAPHIGDEKLREVLRQVIRDKRPDLGRTVVLTGLEDVEEFGLARADGERVLGDIDLIEKVPSYQIIGAVAEGYTNQVLGLRGSAAKVEHSFAGDLMHSLYLPHVELWRGDRRFAEVVRTALPQYATKIVGTPGDLLAAIDALLRSQTKSSATNALG